MKRILLLFSFLLINLGINAQTNPAYIIRLDSLPVKTFDLSAKGNLNIQQTRKTSYGSVNVLIVRGQRPAANYYFASVAELNQSDLTERIRKTGQPGDRLMIELVPPKGNSLNFIIPIK
jgi:hypothetical protein